MLGIVIPAHNEAERLSHCLAAVRRAAVHSALGGEPVSIVVVLDACTDDSENIAKSAGVETLTIAARNVGCARAAGAEALIARGARWLSFTDADTLVADDWLAMQLSQRADVVCGTVSVSDWSAHGVTFERVRARFTEHYNDADDHRHIHGANLGVCVEAYRRVGGFAPLALSEDVALVEALMASGARIAWSAAPRVTTSARIDARASGGFGDTLRSFASDAWPRPHPGAGRLMPG